MRADGVQWSEVPSLFGAGANQRVFATLNQSDGTCDVLTGDGVEGDTLPTGQSNSHAFYRYGLGAAGNVGAAALTTLLDRPLGVNGVTNPEPATGGQDPESIADVRANAPIDPQWFANIASEGWQQRWLENFTSNQGGFTDEEDLVQDGWTDIARRFRSRIMSLPSEQMTPQNMMAAFEDADYEKMDEIRARVEALVRDRETAQKLKAWYRQLCKRPCFHDAYLQAFNTPGTHLVDTDGNGVERITENGIVVAGKEYQLDCIIYASGFEVGTEYKRRAGFDLTGRGGVKLSDHWSAGMRTKHGIHVHGFPNAFFVQPTQGANLISNVPHNLTEAAKTIALMIRHAQANGLEEIEVTKEAEDRWVELLLTGAGRMIGSPDCTPGYYNNEGREPGPAAKLNVGHPAGPMAYFKYIDAWRGSGQFEGLQFR